MDRYTKRTSSRKSRDNSLVARHQRSAVDNLSTSSVLQLPAKSLRQPIWQPSLPVSSAARPVSGHSFGAVPLFSPSASPVQARDKGTMTTGVAGPGFVRPSQTGMPDKMRKGLERLSGFDLSSVRVHYNSAKPSQIHAHAYTQGKDVHVGPGQERHLPHEGWHVVQQMQGRVSPTVRMPGVAMNLDTGLEREADEMGERVLQTGAEPGAGELTAASAAALAPAAPVIQPMMRRVNTSRSKPGSRDSERDKEREPSRDKPVAASSSAKPDVVFDQRTHRIFLEATGGADIKSEDKTFHMLPDDDRVWAVASGGTIGREYEALRSISESGGNTVLAGRKIKALAFGKPTDAYPMHWVAHAISSKSQWPEFKAALAGFANNANTRRSIEGFRRVAESIDIADFQAVLDPGTGIIYANDPRAVSGANPNGTMNRRLDLWEQAMQAEQHEAEEAPELEFLDTDWDAEFDRKWREKEVEGVPEDRLAEMFTPEQLALLDQIGQHRLEDRAGRRWIYRHTDKSRGIVYLEPA